MPMWKWVCVQISGTIDNISRFLLYFQYKGILKIHFCGEFRDLSAASMLSYAKRKLLHGNLRVTRGVTHDYSNVWLINPVMTTAKSSINHMYAHLVHYYNTVAPKHWSGNELVTSTTYAAGFDGLEERVLAERLHCKFDKSIHRSFYLVNLISRNFVYIYFLYFFIILSCLFQYLTQCYKLRNRKKC